MEILLFSARAGVAEPCKNQKCRYKTQSGLLDFGLFF